MGGTEKVKGQIDVKIGDGFAIEASDLQEVAMGFIGSIKIDIKKIGGTFHQLNGNGFVVT